MSIIPWRYRGLLRGGNMKSNMNLVWARSGRFGFGSIIAVFIVTSALMLQIGGVAVASSAIANNKAETCRSGTGQKITNRLICKGLAYYKGKTVLLWANGNVGAAADLLFRAIAPGVAAYLDCTVNVGDQGSGGGIAGTNAAADSPPSGLEVGFLEVSQDTADQAEKAPGANFPLSKIVSVGGTHGTIAVLVSSASSGIKSIKQLLIDPQPTKWLEILNSSFEPLMKMVIAAYHDVPAHIVTGYSGSANLTEGFERGDGPVTGTSVSTLGPLLTSGKAIPLMSDKPLSPGDPYYQVLKNVPTPASLLKSYPPKTKAGKIVMKALVTYENSGVSLLEMPRHTPAAYSSAMAAAMKSAFANPSIEAQIVAGGTPPGLIPVSKSYQILEAAIKSEKTLAKFLP